MTNAPEDRDLVRAFLGRGDEAAFRVLFRRHTPAMFLLASRLLGGADRGAEDAVQEAWSRAARRLSVFRAESTLRTWLCGIVVRCCREMLRRRRPETELDLEMAAGGGPEGEEAFELERVLARLPDGFREIVVLHDLEGYTHREIGVRLGIRPGSSKSRLSRARAALRESLGIRR